MDAEKLKAELIGDTVIEDIAENYRPVVNLIGIENFIKLSDYTHGDELYFPKTESVLTPARNRRIKREWNGNNADELARKYNLTNMQINNILKDAVHPDQMSIFDILGKEEK